MKETNKAKFLEDYKGNKSCKRLVGCISFLLGAVGSVYLFIISSNNPPAGDPETMKDIINSCFFLAGGLVGGGVIEGFKITNKK